MESAYPERRLSLIRRRPKLALTLMPASTTCVHPFATSAVPIDGEMATLIGFYAHVILPRARFHKTISKACSNLTAIHALQHPMLLLYAVLCRASMEPRPEDGDRRDGARMHQASVSRAGSRESIKFKLQAIKYLNEQISTARLDDDHFPVLHTISFLLRIEVSHTTHKPRCGYWDRKLQANWRSRKTIHGNVQLVRAHLSGMQQLQALGVQLGKYAYCSVAPII